MLRLVFGFGLALKPLQPLDDVAALSGTIAQPAEVAVHSAFGLAAHGKKWDVAKEPGLWTTSPDHSPSLLGFLDE